MDLHKAFDSVDHDVLPDRYSPVRSSHLEVYCKKGVLRNFTKFTGRDPGAGVFL